MVHREVPLRDERENIVKWYGTSFDIEDRKRAEERAREDPPLPGAYFAFVAVATGVYLLLVEAAKRRLLRGAAQKNAIKPGNTLAAAA